jgi:putative hydrolase of the HAD superfamily
MPSAIRAVFFDAVGTLIHPHPSPGEVYALVGRRWGSRLPLDAIVPRFRLAFAREDEIDREAGWRTSEAREIERWRRIVGTVLDDVTDPEGCFQELREHFARPEVWRCESGVETVFAALAARGLVVGVASNFDGRLRRVLAGLPPLRSVWRLVISSEMGWRKPAPEFFSGLCRVTGLAGDEILMVGDDPVNDGAGAEAAGLRILLLDSRCPAGDGRCLARLADLPRVLERLC